MSGAAVMFLGACGVPTDARPRNIPAKDLRLLQEPDQPAPEAGAAEIEVPVYLVRDGLLDDVPRRLAAPPVLSQVLGALFQPLTEDERRQGFGTQLEGPTVPLGSPVVVDGVAQISLSDAFLHLRLHERVLALGQIVSTVTSPATGVRAVVFSVGENPPEPVPTPDGVVNRPLTKTDFRKVQAP